MANNLINANKLSPFLRSIEDSGIINPFNYVCKNNLGIGLKKRIYSEELSLSNFYNERIVFKVPVSTGLLSGVTLKLTLSTLGDNSLVRPFLALNVFKEILLETVSQTKTIQKLTRHSLKSIIEQLDYDTLQYYYNTMAPSSTFNNNTITCYNPLILYLNEDPSLFINTNIVEPLQITLFTADSFSNIGLQADLSAFKIQVIYTYFEMVKEPPENIDNFLTYDTYDELPVDLVTGQTSATLQLNCLKTIYNMNLMVRSSGLNYVPVNSFQLWSGNKLLIDYSDKLEYEQYSSTFTNTGNILIYWFSMFKDRLRSTIGQNLYDIKPLTLIVNFNSVPSIGSETFKLYCFYEYFKSSTINKNGFFISDDSY